MSKRIVTIGREYGSGGREIGSLLAKELGWGFYDRGLIDLAAEKSGIKAEVLEKADEMPTNPFFMESNSVLISAHASSTRSIALSGRKRSEI